MTQTRSVPLRSDFPGLDWLRAVGALAVLTTHVAFQTGEYFRHGTLGTLLARLDVGVALFFVLSGFLLSRDGWARHELGLEPQRTRRYALKRALRILPVYVVTVVVAWSVVPGNEGRGGWSWLATLTITDSYVDDTLPHGLTQMWSLGAEVAFYVILPVLMWLSVKSLRGSSLSGPVLVTMVLLNVTWVLAIVPAITDQRDWAPNLWVPGYLLWFAAGMWLAREHVKHQAGRASRMGQVVAQLGGQPGVCWVAGFGLLLLAATPVAGPVSLEPGSASQAMVKVVCYAMIGLLLVAAGVWAHPRGALMRAVSGRVPRHLGHVSYSVFCVHLIVLALYEERTGYELFSGDFPLVFVTVLALTLGASELLYWFIERPAMRLARRGRRSSRTQAPAAVHASSTR